GAAAIAAAMMQSRMRGSDLIAAFTMTDAFLGAARTAALTIWLMAERESVCCCGRPFIQEMFSAETTILAARSGRSVTAVATHEANSGPSNRTATVMNPVRNSSLAIWAALFDARTVIGTAIVSSGAGAVCVAAATLG